MPVKNTSSASAQTATAVAVSNLDSFSTNPVLQIIIEATPVPVSNSNLDRLDTNLVQPTTTQVPMLTHNQDAQPGLKTPSLVTEHKRLPC